VRLIFRGRRGGLPETENLDPDGDDDVQRDEQDQVPAVVGPEDNGDSLCI
jgi:hypothetical protein